MPSVDYAKLRTLAALSSEDVGPSEEDVKINFVVPLLEALGHTRLRFEHRQRDIVLRAGPARGVTIFVETKRYGEPLDRHLDQLERYAAQERCLLAVLTNGEEVRAYVPLWSLAPSFADTLLLGVRRGELGGIVAARRLARLLGAEALSTGAADRDIRTGQARREQAWKHLAAIRTQAHRQRERLDARLRDLAGQAEKLDAEKRGVEGQLGRLDAALERSLDTLRTLYGVREAASRPPSPQPPPSTESAPAPAGREQPLSPARPLLPLKRRGKHDRGHGWATSREWTDRDLTAMSSDNQQRILGAFVRAGRRTLGIYEIAAAVGLTPNQAWGSVTGFLTPVRVGRKDPLLDTAKPPRADRDRLGTLISVREEYWDTLCRLYPAAPPS